MDFIWTYGTLKNHKGTVRVEMKHKKEEEKEEARKTYNMIYSPPSFQ